MQLIKNFKRKRAIKSYIKKLPRLLEKDYGKSKIYTPMQVKKTIERSKLSVDYACYGIAIFSTKKAFDNHHIETDESCNYDQMHSEIADSHFEGNSDFGIADVTAVSSAYGSDYSSGGFDSGGDCGGGD